jgi:hypothetical protein
MLNPSTLHVPEKETSRGHRQTKMCISFMSPHPFYPFLARHLWHIVMVAVNKIGFKKSEPLLPVAIGIALRIQT